MKSEQRLTLRDGLARLGMNLNAGTRLHRIILDGSARAKSPRGNAHAQGIHTNDRSIGLSTHLMSVHGTRHGCVGVTALLANHRAPAVHGAPVAQGGLHVSVVHASKIEHVTGKLASQLDDIGRATARKHLDGFFNLEGIADLPAQRHGHVGQQSARSDARVAS